MSLQGEADQSVCVVCVLCSVLSRLDTNPAAGLMIYYLSFNHRTAHTLS